VLPWYRDPQEVARGFLYGLINALMCVPVTISFATIIFRDEAFFQYLPALVRLVIFSGAVHAFCFGCLSSLPFAVGQVQDAGLIFLSSMATTIAQDSLAKGYEPDLMVATVLVLLSLSTATLGLALIVVGKLKLASLVQYLPMPVIGGYLAFIGYIMAQAGLSFMTQEQILSIKDWPKLFHTCALLRLIPGVFLGVFMYVSIRRLRHALVLPGCMAIAVCLFFVILFSTGTSLETARLTGWIAKPRPPAPFWEAWKAIDFSRFGDLNWSATPLILPTWVGMFLVVAFSSSLDVAAIETEVRRPLDYNRELQMIGVSNAVSGLFVGFTGESSSDYSSCFAVLNVLHRHPSFFLCGYTGSYIFSQTIFTLRAGARSRLCSFVIVFLELATFMLPVSPIAYVPRFFFGGLLILIAVDLMMEWLIAARRKMMAGEYVVTLLTFIAIQCTNIEIGMTVGIVCALAVFAIGYSKAPAVLIPRIRRSSVMRTFEERREYIFDL